MSAHGILGFDILRPWLIALALVGPVLFALGVIGLRGRRKARRALVAERHERRFLPRFSENRARFRVVCAALAALFLALGAIGPVRGYTLRDVQRKGIDLVFCVDTSRSMLTQDVKPDRLTRARREVIGLLDKLRGDRAAVIAFSGDARDVAPLTHDRLTLGMFVNTLSTDDNERGGTDIGAALEHALSLFDGRTGAHEAIVLITDGEDLEGRGLEVAKKAKERGIKVYLVGMGTVAGGKIPDGKGGFMRGEDGKEVVSTLDGTSLQAIADLTGGAYLSVENSPIPLEELYEKRITKLESRELFAGKERIPHDRYQWPLVLAAAFMLFEFALRERRPEDRSEREQRRAEKAARRASPASEPVRGAA